MNNNTSNDKTNDKTTDKTNDNNDKTTDKTTDKTDDKTSKNNDNKTSKNKNNYGIIPYIIVFAVLFIISLILLTWMLDVWYKSRTCQYNSEIWCSDNWICNNNAAPNGAFSTCPSTSGENDGTINIYSDCFTKADKPGLASCLFGLTSYKETVCGATGSTDDQKCGCPPDVLYTNGNCLLGCNNNNPLCCCCPGTTGCHFKSVEEFCAISNDNPSLNDCYEQLTSEDNFVCRLNCKS
jgi:hypothetical protein